MVQFALLAIIIIWVYCIVCRPSVETMKHYLITLHVLLKIGTVTIRIRSVAKLLILLIHLAASLHVVSTDGEKSRTTR
jgi:hypothetical protein